MTSEGRVCLGLAHVKRYGVPCLDIATRKVRVPNERLCRGTESERQTRGPCRLVSKTKTAVISSNSKNCKCSSHSAMYLSYFEVRRLFMRLLGRSLLIKSLKFIFVIQVFKIFIIILNTQQTLYMVCIGPLPEWPQH